MDADFDTKSADLTALRIDRSDGLAHETYPMAFQRMNGNVSLHELRTTSPIAQ